MSQEIRVLKLSDIHIHDPFILQDTDTKTYYLCVYHAVGGDPSSKGLAVYTSEDPDTWRGPFSVFKVGRDLWAQEGVWAPELREYSGKHYLFVTFNTNDQLRDQWHNWLPRVKRGAQVLVSPSPIVLYQPNRRPDERACLFEPEDIRDSVHLQSDLKQMTLMEEKDEIH
jgi:hypothetical protein